jgi:hypothetical protein
MRLYAIQTSDGTALINGLNEVKIYVSEELALKTLATLEGDYRFKNSRVMPIQLVSEVN